MEENAHLTPSATRQKQIITFAAEDPGHPQNWPTWRKLLLFVPLIPLDFSVSWMASGFSPASKSFTGEFNVGSEVGVLGLSMYVFGLAWGPMLQAPLSEHYGRRPIYIWSYGISLIFMMATALAPNVGGLLAFRFLTGLFASCTIANLGGTIADMYHLKDVGYPMSFYLWAATAGSPTGNLLMSFVAQYRPWRDVMWALLGINGGIWLVVVATQIYAGETRPSAILVKRANKAWKEHQQATNRNEQHTAAFELPEEYQRRGWRELIYVTLSRPFRFLLFEPVIIFMACYNGYFYGLSFLFNDSFQIVFGSKGHGFNTLGTGLSFLGIIVGQTSGLLTNIWQERTFQRTVKKTGGAIVPESRVQISRFAAVVFPLSLFWFAWTTYKSVHWIVPIIASAFFGWSFFTLILMTYTYTEDAYQTYAASALAGIGVVRNMVGGGFPLFANAMYARLGNQWASTLLAFLALLLAPIPFILQKYGRRLRLRSPWAREHMEDKDLLSDSN